MVYNILSSGESITSIPGTVKRSYLSYSIAPNIPQVLRLSNFGAATFVRLTLYRNGAVMQPLQVDLRGTLMHADLDLSVFAAADENILSQLREVQSDSIRHWVLCEEFNGGQPLNSITIGVNLIPSPGIGQLRMSNGFENLFTRSLGEPLNISRGASTTIVSDNPSREFDFLDTREVTFRLTKETGWPFVYIFPANHASPPPIGDTFSASIYFKNGSDTPLELRLRIFDPDGKFLKDYPRTVDPNTGGLFKWEGIPGRSSDGVGTPRANRVGFLVITKSSVPSTTNITFEWCRMSMYRGNCAMLWTPNPIDAGGLEVKERDPSIYMIGALTDYRDGYKVAPVDTVLAMSPEQGLPFKDRFFWGTNPYDYSTASSKKSIYTEMKGGKGGLTMLTDQGFISNMPGQDDYDGAHVRITNIDGVKTYGWCSYRKMPNLPPQSNRIGINWLNTVGSYDQMYFENYTVKPVMTSGGPGVAAVLSHYEVTVTGVIDWNSELAYQALTQSAHIRIMTPQRPFVYCLGEIIGSNFTYLDGSSKTKPITLRFKAFPSKLL